MLKFFLLGKNLVRKILWKLNFFYLEKIWFKSFCCWKYFWLWKILVPKIFLLLEFFLTWKRFKLEKYFHISWPEKIKKFKKNVKLKYILSWKILWLWKFSFEIYFDEKFFWLGKNLIQIFWCWNFFEDVEIYFWLGKILVRKIFPTLKFFLTW